MNERLRRRLELRRSNAAVPHRNRYRERKTGKGKADMDIIEGITCTIPPEKWANDFLDEGIVLTEEEDVD